MGGTMKVIKSVILSLIIGGLTIAAGEQIENADKVEDTIVNSDESGDALESRVLEGTPHYTGTGNLRQGKQLRGLALRLGDAARRAAVRDELTRQGTIAALQDRRDRKYYSNTNLVLISNKKNSVLGENQCCYGA